MFLIVRNFIKSKTSNVNWQDSNPQTHLNLKPWFNKMETNKVKKEHYLMRQNNTIYNFSIKLSSIGQDKSKLKKQISKLLILITMAA